MNSLGLANFVTRCQSYLKNRAFLLDMITLTERYPLPDTVSITPTEEQDTYLANTNVFNLNTKKLSVSPIVTDPRDNTVYGLAPITTANVTKMYKIHDQSDTPIMDIYDEFILSKGMIANYLSDQPISTTYGLFILNYFVLADPLGTYIPYVNELFNWKKIQSQVANGILHGDLHREEYDKFLNNVYFIGSFTELSVPSLTTKSMTTDPKVRQRRDELFAKYKDQLDDPLIIAKIEDELIAMDRAYLKDDPASSWILDQGDWETARKKMFITSGVSEAFSDDSNEFTFIPNAYNEKMDFSKFPAIANDIRRGSYMRGKETAKGGEETKFVLRIFQNVSITEDDCHAKEGINVVLSADQFREYQGRHVLDKGQDIVLTKENFGKYIDRPITIRSPMYCHAKDGFCYACFGEIYRLLGLKSVGMKVVEASSSLMSASMSAMHRSKVSTVTIDDLDAFTL